MTCTYHSLHSSLLQGIERRCANLAAWLATHAAQLARLHCDLPPGWEAATEHPFMTPYKDRWAARLACRPALEQAVWRHRSAFYSLVLGGRLLEAALAAAVSGGGGGGGGLDSCTSLHSLELSGFEGSTQQLAALLAALPAAVQSHLHLCMFWEDRMPRELVGAPPPGLASSALAALCLNRPGTRMPSSPVFPEGGLPQGLLACHELTSLDLSVPATDQLEEITQLRWAGLPACPPARPPACLHLRVLARLPVTPTASLLVAAAAFGTLHTSCLLFDPPAGTSHACCRSLASLRVCAPWQQVPAVLGLLPLTRLHLVDCNPPTDTLAQRLSGGMPAALCSLAPTLQVGRAADCWCEQQTRPATCATAQCTKHPWNI
jgi:hypothetical protein